MDTYYIDLYDCQETEILWEIVKPNGEYEVYTVVNYSHYHYGRRESITERGLSFGGLCYYECNLRLTISEVQWSQNHRNCAYT